MCSNPKGKGVKTKMGDEKRGRGMTIQVLSDLHLEFRPLALKDILVPMADVLVLAGDVGVVGHPSLEPFLKECATAFEHVLVVMGNHEYYNYSGDMGSARRALEDTLASDPCLANVSLLDNGLREVSGVVFLGSTLWSWIPDEHLELVQRQINDYHSIFAEPGVKLTPTLSRDLYLKNVEWLQETMRATDPEKPLVVITHHAPCVRHTSHPRFEDSPRTCAFASDLGQSLFPRRIDLWIAGHTHYNFDHSENGYHLVSNQYGYGSYPEKGYAMSRVYTIKIF
jgi:DNA repair exonuclease SbcCD nuclease subunit